MKSSESKSDDMRADVERRTIVSQELPTAKWHFMANAKTGQPSRLERLTSWTTATLRPVIHKARDDCMSPQTSKPTQTEMATLVRICTTLLMLYMC
jgi:hypothetical protein